MWKSPDKESREPKCDLLKNLVALVLFGDVPKRLGQRHFEETSGTRPGHVRDMSGWRHILGKFEKGHRTSLRN